MTSRPGAPEPLPLPVVDDHTHLDHVRSGAAPVDVAEGIQAAVAVNVPRMIQIGCDLDSARWTLKAVDTYPALLGGVALHPTEASKLVAAQRDPGTRRRDLGIDEISAAAVLDAAIGEIAAMAEHPRIRVVGETGLDHYWVGEEDVAGRAAQEESFRRHIRLARDRDLVLQIHDRDAHADVLRVLREEGAPRRTVFHCFSGDREMARYCADAGWYLSFAGTLTFRNAGALREALRAVPLDQVQVETDAPYLAPMPHRGKVNASYLVPLTVRCMAEVVGQDLERVCATLAATAEALYGPW